MKKTTNTLGYWLIIITTGVGLGYVGYMAQGESKSQNQVKTILPETNKAEQPPLNKITEAEPDAKTEPAPVQFDSLVKQNVAFVSQAPTGNWKDPRQQDACEEASAWMAVAWARGEKLESGVKAEKKIVEIADWQKKNYGEFHDTSIKDTADRILSEFFKFDDYEIINDVTIEQLKSKLHENKIVIIAADGKKLSNPNFLNGGPDRHMLLLIGYDPLTDEFIANDPGTRLGAGYRYKATIIDQALRDYPTGHHEPITTTLRNAIVIEQDK